MKTEGRHKISSGKILDFVIYVVYMFLTISAAGRNDFQISASVT